MTTPTTGVLIGYGSVGRYHAAALASRGPLAVVDGNPQARRRAGEAQPQARVADRLEALDGSVDWPGALAVIATWGPSHASLFHALADRGVRRILCEKPMASSVALARKMVERSRRDGIALAVHHYIRYAGLVRALSRVARERGLGDPVAVVSAGGACCLLTNGIHLIDFAAELFGASARRVVSTASGVPINPRSPDLMFYGGTAVWSFDGGREAVITLHNGSSLAWVTRVFYRDAVVEFDGDLVTRIDGRDPAAVERWPAVTRTGPAAHPLQAGRMEGVGTFEGGLLAALEDVGGGQPRICTGDAGEAAVSACIGALLAARAGRAIELPIDPRAPEGEEEWPIS